MTPPPVQLKKKQMMLIFSGLQHFCFGKVLIIINDNNYSPVIYDFGQGEYFYVWQ